MQSCCVMLGLGRRHVNLLAGGHNAAHEKGFFSMCLYPRPGGEHSPIPAGHPGLGRTGEETEKVGRIPSPRDFSVLSLAALVAQGPDQASHHSGSPRVSMMAPGDGASGPSVQPQPELPWGLPGTWAPTQPWLLLLQQPQLNVTTVALSLGPSGLQGPRGSRLLVRQTDLLSLQFMR